MILMTKAISGSEKGRCRSEVNLPKPTFRYSKEDLSALGITPANSYARASEHVDDMVALGEKAGSKRTFAYEKLRLIVLLTCLTPLMLTAAFPGSISTKIKVGATVDLDDYEKQNPRDFHPF